MAGKLATWTACMLGVVVVAWVWWTPVAQAVENGAASTIQQAQPPKKRVTQSNKRAPGQTKKASSQVKKATSQTKKMPSQTKKAPGQPKKAPSQPKKAPSQPKQMPSQQTPATSEPPPQTVQPQPEPTPAAQPVGQQPVMTAEPAFRERPIGESAWVELELRWWFPTLSGSVQSSVGTTVGSTLDLQQTLGVDTTKNFLWPKATLHFADRHRLWATYLGMDYTGATTLTQAIEFGGATFPAGTATTSEIDVKEIVGAYQYDLLKFSRATVRLDLQVHYYDFKGSLSGAGVGTIQEDFQFALPTIGGGVDIWPFDWLKIGGDFNVFKLTVSGMKGQILDGQAGVTISPWEWLGISGGYRYLKINVDDTKENDQVNWLQDGFYGSVMVRF